MRALPLHQELQPNTGAGTAPPFGPRSALHVVPQYLRGALGRVS
jgi:hypothetical protein